MPVQAMLAFDNSESQRVFPPGPRKTTVVTPHMNSKLGHEVR